MANTIITKNSSTASAVPTSGDLVQGELAVNVTDKRLFTENSGGTVVELGTNPSQLNFVDNAKAIFGAGSDLQIYHDGTTSKIDGAVTLTSNVTLGDASGDSVTFNASTVSTPNGLNFDSNTFVIDAANNRVGIGTSSPAAPLDCTVSADGISAYFRSLTSSSALNINHTSNKVDIATGSSDVLSFSPQGTERMRIDTSGNVGIGTSSPAFKLHTANAGTNYLAIDDTANDTRVLLGTASGAVAFYARGIASSSTAKDILFATGATERMRLDSSGNLGLGVTPSAWSTAWTSLNIAGNLSLAGRSSNTEELYLSANAFNDGSWKYIASNFATQYYQDAGTHVWRTAPSGTAGNAISFSQAMTLTSGGSLLIGTSSSVSNNRLVIDQASGDGANSGFYLQRNGAAGTSFKIDIDSSDVVHFRRSTTDALTLTSAGNLGLGVTPSAWASAYAAFQVKAAAAFWGTTDTSFVAVGANTFNAASGSVYINTDFASRYYQIDGAHVWQTAPSGTAGNAITFTQAMTLDASGRLGVGTSSPAAKVHIAGSSTTDFDALTLRNGDGTVGSAAVLGFEASSGTLGDDAALAAQIKGIRTGSGTSGALTFWTNNAGVPAERARITSDGYLRMASGSLGIQFNGDTAAANALDDYEEGTWTPVIADALTGGNVATGTFSGTYTKVGRVVTLTVLAVNINTTGMTAGNDLYIQGLPFTAISVTNTQYYTGAVQLSSTTVVNSPCLSLSDNTTYIRIAESAANTALDYMIVSEFTSGSADIWGTITYEAA